MAASLNRLSFVKRDALLKQERRRQIRGLTWLVLAILLSRAVHAGLHIVLTPGWWRPW